MNTFIIAIMLLLTIASALGLGIAVGYWMIMGVLQLMGSRPEAKPAAQLATQTHGGD